MMGSLERVESGLSSFLVFLRAVAIFVRFVYGDFSCIKFMSFDGWKFINQSKYGHVDSVTTKFP